MKYYYMCKDECLEVFDVNEQSQTVSRRTVRFEPLWTPFQSYDPNIFEFRRFLESRCFPKYRANKREILDMMGIENYVPWKIVTLTHGAIMNDPCWILHETDTGDITVHLSGGEVVVNAEAVRAAVG